ncbi:MAG: SDR family NAD(P)-dependent oxidoreductase [Alphaproteobacteria bacterium]|nr:SDR family NAD(P)-dependent oxidoreductase [Alphaproteobacteria bacterium]
MSSILVTGAAGFIGFHAATRLLRDGKNVIGLDNMNSYYDPLLKEGRLGELRKHKNFTFVKADLADKNAIDTLFEKHKFSHVFHLGAQAGVRYSLENPDAYVQSNVNGFLNILEACRAHKPQHLLYASSSSVYGGNDKYPFTETDTTDHPLSLYAATKKANEMMGHSYAHLFGLNMTGMRFFTVYGPWGRPDMAVYKFTDAIFNGKPLDLFNHGDMERDFTYVDDIVESMVRLQDKPPQNKPPHQIVNLGNHKPENVKALIALIEKETNCKAIINNMPMQPGDVYKTYADNDRIYNLTGFKPQIALAEGVKNFVTWYRSYHAGSASRA